MTVSAAAITFGCLFQLSYNGDAITVAVKHVAVAIACSAVSTVRYMLDIK